FGHDLARGRQQIELAQRFAHGMSARGQKGIGHAAADDERVDLREQAAEQVELGRHLGAAADRCERMGSGPFGRPKWESRTTLPPLSAISRMVGATRSMRVVSATSPFSTGTLRSTRTSTRLPLTSASSSVWNMLVLIAGGSDQLPHRASWRSPIGCRSTTS